MTFPLNIMYGRVAKSKDTKDMDTDELEFDPNDDGPLNLPFGQLFFGFPVVLPKRPEDEEANKASHVFTGAGQTLRNKKSSAQKTSSSKRDGKMGVMVGCNHLISCTCGFL